MGKGNILIIDDSSTIRHGITLILKQADIFENYFESAGAEEGLVVLDNHPVEVVICDIVMPGMDGFEFLKEMKNRQDFRDIPVILLTGQESVDKKIKGLDLGASDYLTKPFDPGELLARVRVQIKVKRLQDELRIAKQRYKELAITDYLTQIYNRRRFMEIFEQEFSRSARYSLPLSLIIMDIDNFKSINDTFGHHQGDVVLKELAAVVKDEVRSHDVFARYGGEEFVLMLPQTSEEGAKLAAEKIRSNIEENTFEGMKPNAVTVSIGVATCTSGKAGSIDAIINAADDALYRAKNNGKNRVEVDKSLKEKLQM